MVEDAGTKGNNVASELPTASAMDSDLESGSLIIDEGDKKKTLKRKPFSTTSNNPVSLLLFYFIPVLFVLWRLRFLCILVHNIVHYTQLLKSCLR